jgi:nitroreductase
MALTFTGTGQLLHFHPVERCTPPCALHAPSDHHMVTWPLHWRDDRRILERICEHGIGHPDPDDAAFRREYAPRNGDSVHGCDGCCWRDAREAGR